MRDDGGLRELEEGLWEINEGIERDEGGDQGRCRRDYGK